MTRNLALTGLLFSLCTLAACGPQYTQSMVNTTRPQAVPETMMQQIYVSDLSDGYLYNLAESYKRYGTSTLKLSLGYDESSKTYTAMNAFSDLASVKSRLTKLGVKSITAETAKIEKGGKPVLWANFDGMKAAAPEGCTTMPGMDNNTTRSLGEYKFGCSIDTALAKQIYRPADLQGNSYMEPGSGRRATTGLEPYHVITDAEANEEFRELGRSDIQAE